MIGRGLTVSFCGCLALILAGCSGTGNEGASPTHSSVGVAIFGNPQNAQPERPAGPQIEYTCPGVDVLEGAAAYRVGGTGGAVAWQASVTDVVRECAFQTGTFVMRVGVEGRVLLGAAGRAGTFTVPVRVTVKRGDKVVASRLSRVSVSVPAGGSVGFSHVEEGIGLPLTDDPGEDYEVLVGFDAGGGGRAGRR